MKRYQFRLFIVLSLMILGTGYFFFSDSDSITLTNNTTLSTLTGDFSRYENVRNQALDTKNLVEQKASDAIRQQSEDLPAEKTLAIVDRFMASGFAVSAKPRVIDTIVLHSSYDFVGKNPYSVSGVIKEYEDYGVSAHYLIDREGTIYRLVEDKNIAYHAGVSRMSDERNNVNDFSIGIEMINILDGQYTEVQYTAVNELIAYLKKQYPIKFIVGHKDIAPDRKTDPWNLDWKKLK